MRIALIADAGCLEYAGVELRVRFGVNKIVFGKTHLEADADEETVVRIIYSAQSVKRVLLLLASGEASDLQELENGLLGQLKSAGLPGLLKGVSIRAECERRGVHDYNSVEAEKIVCGVVSGLCSTRINLGDPGAEFFLLVEDNNYVLGLDLAGRDLSKRQYKVFTNPVELKGSIAFCLLLFSGYIPGKVLVDPFALSGTIPIEAALYSSGVPVNYYNKQFAAVKSGFISKDLFEKTVRETDMVVSKPGKHLVFSLDASFRNVSAQKKNAKIAGVEKYVAFSRMDTDWLDIKMGGVKTDIICGKPLEHSRAVPERKARDSYKSLFMRAKNFLSENGCVCLVTVHPVLMLEEARLAGFRESKTAVVFQGKQELYFTRLEISE